MITETIFYVTGSIFFVIVIAVFFISGFILLKILKNIEKISTDIQSTTSEIRSKVTNFYFGFAGLAGLLEKLMEFAKEKKEKDKKEAESDDNREADGGEPENYGKKAESVKKEKKAKKIKVFEINQE
jgi:fucose permease